MSTDCIRTFLELGFRELYELAEKTRAKGFSCLEVGLADLVEAELEGIFCDQPPLENSRPRLALQKSIADFAQQCGIPREPATWKSVNLKLLRGSLRAAVSLLMSQQTERLLWKGELVLGGRKFGSASNACRMLNAMTALVILRGS